jgi:uncharacterized protein (DUF1697 family)
MYVAFLSAINVAGRASVKKSDMREAFTTAACRNLRTYVQSGREALEAVAMSEREVFVVSRRKKNGFFGFPNILVEKELGVSATCRNWSTVTKIAQWIRMEANG